MAKRGKLAIMVGNAKREIKNLQKRKGRWVKGKKRISEKDIQEANIRRHWKKKRVEAFLQQVAETADV